MFKEGKNPLKLLKKLLKIKWGGDVKLIYLLLASNGKRNSQNIKSYLATFHLL